jgi:hypothetical protein
MHVLIDPVKGYRQRTTSEVNILSRRLSDPKFGRNLCRLKEILTCSISYCKDNIKCDSASNAPKCSLNNDVSIVQKHVVKLSESLFKSIMHVLIDPVKGYRQRTTSEVNILSWVDLLTDIKRKGYNCFIKISYYLKVVICLELVKHDMRDVSNI